MNILQIVMTGFLAGVTYFFLVTFTEFDYHDGNLQLISLAAIVAGSYLVARKVFA